MNRRRKVFDKHLAGFVLGEATQEHVKQKLGEPARTLSEEKVTVFEYDDPEESSIIAWKKVQFIFFEGLLLNVSYVEPAKKLSRAALHKVLGQPDESPEEDEDDEEGEGLSEIFEVELDEEPMLSFAAHYDADENVEALSLCAEISEDLLDDGDGDADDADDGDDDADEEDDDKNDEKAAGEGGDD